MNHLIRLMLVALCMSLSAPASAAQPAPPAALDAEFLGMVARDPWYDFGTRPGQPNQPNTSAQERMGQLLAQAGVRWVRIDIHIAGDQVEQEIAKNDYFIRTVAPRYGLKLLALLSFDLLKGQDPRLFNTGPYTVTSRFGGGVNRAMDTWLTRALAVADRYRGDIHGYEVLNEQNRLPYFDPNGYAGEAIKPEVVARLMAKFYRFCKNIDPANQNHGCARDTPIILGGLHPRGTSAKPVAGQPETIISTDAAYLQQVYDPSNSQSPFVDFKSRYGFYPLDGVGYHPYPEEIKHSIEPSDVFVNRGVERMRQVLGSVGDQCSPFWVTEIGMNVGFDSDGPANPTPAITADQQAAFMNDVYRSLYERKLSSTACGEKREIASVFWFKYEDFPPASSRPAQGVWAQPWGIVRIPFTESASCPGGACYDLQGQPAFFRSAFYIYRELAGKPVYRTNLPVVTTRKSTTTSP